LYGGSRWFGGLEYDCRRSGESGHRDEKAKGRADGDLFVSGRTYGTSSRKGWASRLDREDRLKTGDRIEVEVLEMRDVDAPKRRKETETPEQRKRFRFEHAKKEYLALRSKFEGA
jgi:hypothetical protein